MLVVVVGFGPVTATGGYVSHGPSQVDPSGTPSPQAGETIEVIVRFDEVNSFLPSNTQVSPQSRQAAVEDARADAVAKLEKKEGVTTLNTFWLVNAALVEINTSTVDIEGDVESIPGVETVHPNFEVQLTADTTPRQLVDVSQYNETLPGIEQVNAPATQRQFETQGDGIRVAVLDTGVDTRHPDINLAEDGWAEFDSQGERLHTFPNDNDGHGTHVSGTVAGGATSGVQIGVAPQTTLLHGKVLSDGGGTFAQIIAGMEWAIEQDTDVITMSFGVPAYSSSVYASAFLKPISKATELGVVVVASSGNYGSGATTSPGNVYESIAVGAVNNTQVPEFSSGGVVATDDAWGDDAPESWPASYVIPDVAAPGVSVVSAAPGGGYATFTGTSMAAPHVAGTTALLLSLNPSLSPSEVKSILRAQARHPTSPNTADARYGEGIVDASRAATDSVSDARIFGTVTTATGVPVAGATVTTATGIRDVTNKTGQFQIPVTPGDRTVYVAPFGTRSASKNITVSNAQQSNLNFALAKQTAVKSETAQPETVPAGGVITRNFTVANVQNVLTEINETDSNVSAANVSLSINGQPASLGEPFSVPSSDTETIRVTATLDPDSASQTFSLTHQFSGEHGTVTKTTGPTSIISDPDRAEFRVVETQLDPRVSQNQSLNTHVIIENTGEVSGETTAVYSVELADVSKSFTQEVTLDAGTQETISWRVYTGELPPGDGSHTIAVGPTVQTSSFVKQAGELTIQNISSPTVAESSDNLTVSATVANVGTVTKTGQIRFTFDSKAVALQRITVPPNSATPVTFTLDNLSQSPGEYSYSLIGPRNSKQDVVEITDSTGVEQYTNSQGEITTDSMRVAINDWRSGKLDTATMRTVIDAWRTGAAVSTQPQRTSLAH